MRVELDIPEGSHAQFVYRMVRTAPYDLHWPAGFTFLFLGSAASALTHFSLLKSAYGFAGALKATLKLVTAQRTAYLVHRAGQVVSTGWCMRDQSKFYNTERGAITIGPIETSESVRGMGLASIALQGAINAHLLRGASIFYIDTSQGNIAAQRVFAKCGWGMPVGAYLRDLN
jgi:RimJ/RimL family protein N-acetyltransferase